MPDEYHDLINKELLEQMAEVVHKTYQAMESNHSAVREQVEPVGWNGAILSLPYEELPEEYKTQNRSFVLSIPEKLTAAGYRISESGETLLSITFPDDAVEVMARMEHVRWMKQKLDAGWIAAGSKNILKKEHDALVLWDQLPEFEREKDRQIIRSIPKILAAAGLVVTHNSK